MSMDKVPVKVIEKLGNSVEFYNLKVRKPEDIEGASIATGLSDNEMDSEVKEFLSDKSDLDFLLVNIDISDGDWGGMSIKFNNQGYAEEFSKLVNEKEGSLRLSSYSFEGWYFYEAE